MQRPVGAAATMNKGAVAEPKSGHTMSSPAAGVGAEGATSMRTNMAVGATNGLAGAVAELKSQHPIRYDDLGPHHSCK